MGECHIKLGHHKEAVHHFLAVVQSKPRSTKGWEALIRTLFLSGQYQEAALQVELARGRLGSRPVLEFYQAAILLALGKNREGFELLEETLELHPLSIRRWWN
jgi:predicted Zn-dependent protease